MRRKSRGWRQLPPSPVRHEPGWFGAFTRNQAEGAIPNGTAIVKVKSEPRDTNPDGTKGTVLGSIRSPAVANNEPFYFVEWESSPRVAVGVIGWKVEALP